MIKVWRALTIANTLVRYGLTQPLTGQSKRRWVRALTAINPFKVALNNRSRGELLCDMLESLGPIFVKFGQQMSVHPDLFPRDIISGLSRLQDKVTPVPNALAKKTLEHVLGGCLNELFDSFDDEPLAAASIAQVYGARLHNGDDVVVKMLRPGIESVIKQDIALMYAGARWARRLLSFGHRLRPIELVEEFEHTILGELDLKKEAASASQLRRNFNNSDIMYVPSIYWPYTSSKTLVMERIHGVRVSDVDTLKVNNANLKKLAEDGVNIFFTQVLRDSFFHADMHPGNLFIDITNPQKPRYIGVDFGIMGSLSDEDQYYLAKNLFAFFNQDYREVARLHLACGWVPSDVREDQFEAAIRTVCEPIFQRPLKDISFAEVLLGLLKTARQFNMEMQPQLMLLQKTLVNIEGLGRRLYPDLDLWKTAKPVIEQWLTSRYAVKQSLKTIKAQLPHLIETIGDLPPLVHTLLKERITTQPSSPKKHRWAWVVTCIIALGLGFIAGQVLS